MPLSRFPDGLRLHRHFTTEYVDVSTGKITAAPLPPDRSAAIQPGLEKLITMILNEPTPKSCLPDNGLAVQLSW
jgi:hypothetical protein